MPHHTLNELCDTKTNLSSIGHGSTVELVWGSALLDEPWRRAGEMDGRAGEMGSHCAPTRVAATTLGPYEVTQHCLLTILITIVVMWIVNKGCLCQCSQVLESPYPSPTHLTGAPDTNEGEF